MSGSRIEVGCEALFFIAIFCSCGVKVIIKTSVFFLFLYSCVLSEYTFLTNVSIFTSSCLIVSLGSLRISLHNTL